MYGQTDGKSDTETGAPPKKQAQEVVFSRKNVKITHPSAIFNKVPVLKASFPKHLAVHFNEKLNSNALRKNYSSQPRYWCN